MNTPKATPTQGIFTGHYQFPVTFEVGQHVVCVAAHYDNASDTVSGLIKGNVYTVSRVWWLDFPFLDSPQGALIIHVKEAVSPDFGYEGGYTHMRFRPLPRLTVDQFMAAPAPLEPVGVSS